MKIRDCFKGFGDEAIGKVMAPSQTCEIVLKKLQKITPPIYQEHILIERPTRVPQYRVLGTEYFKGIAKQGGSNGKGHTKEQALASGLMEFVERYSCRKFFLFKTPKVASFYDLRDNLYRLEDFYSHCFDKKAVKIVADARIKNVQVGWYRGYTLKGDSVYLPVPLLSFMLQGTNGMAAGNSFEEALLHGICEVVERHVAALIETQKLKTPSIDINTIRCPTAQALIRRFQSLGQKVQIKDFSLNLGMPVVGVLRNISARECIVTAGVATSRDEALVRALTENSQGEGSVEENHRKASELRHSLSCGKSVSWDTVPDIENNNIKTELETVEKLLERQGMRIFFVDTTDRTLKIPSVFVVVSGAKSLDSRIANRNMLVGLVDESFRLGRYRQMSQLIGMAEKIDGKNRPFYRIMKAMTFLRHSRYKKAIELFAGCLDARRSALPNCEMNALRGIALTNLAICSVALKRYDDAVNYFIKLLTINPGMTFNPTKPRHKIAFRSIKDTSLLQRAEKIFCKAKLLYNYQNQSEVRCNPRP